MIDISTFDISCSLKPQEIAASALAEGR